MLRRLYQCLIWLHPSAFRLRFEEEMLWIFDEGADGWGMASLFGDASLSRSPVAAALRTVAMGGCHYPGIHPPHRCFREFPAVGQAHGPLILLPH